MKPEDNRTWSSLLTRDMVVKVLLPLSIFAALSGTFPTDATLLQYLEQSQGLTEEAAVALVSIKTYSTLIFIAPVVLLTLAYGARLVMFSGALSQTGMLGILGAVSIFWRGSVMLRLCWIRRGRRDCVYLLRQISSPKGILSTILRTCRIILVCWAIRVDFTGSLRAGLAS